MVFKIPISSQNPLDERLDLVEAFVEDSVLRNIFYETSLRRVPDLPRLSRRLQMSKANLQVISTTPRPAFPLLLFSPQ